MIALEKVSKVYAHKNKKSTAAIKEVDLEVANGEFIVVTGRSGSGKTTLLNLIAGLARPTSGKILVENTNIWDINDAQRSALRSKKMGFVFQFPSLLQSLTSLENVVLPTIFHQQKATAIDFSRAKELLDLVGLSDKITSFPRNLSAGEQQRVVIARALMNEPELLLADEPTSNLDEQTEKEIVTLFEQIHKSRAITILLVTHVGQLTTQGTRHIQIADGIILSDQTIT